MNPDPAPKRRRLATCAALFLLLLAPAVLLGESLFGDHVYVPFDVARFPPKATVLADPDLDAILAEHENLGVTEIPVLVLPELELAREELAEGRFPAWNPGARFGAPLFANGLAGMAYPPNWSLWAYDDPADGLAWTAWLALATAGLLAFAFLRDLGTGTPAALLGALAFAVGGTATANAHFYMRLDALIWLPGLLLACRRVALAPDTRARILPTLGLGLCTALTLVAGFPPFAVACLVAAGVWSLCLLLGTARRAGPGRALASAGMLLFGIVLGAALAAIQLAPMFAYFPESSREVTQTFASLRGQSYGSYGWLGYLMPEAFSVPGGLPYESSSSLVHLLHHIEVPDGSQLVYPTNYNFVEYTVYVGTLPLLLAVVGLVAGRGPLRFGLAALLALLGLLANTPGFLEPFYGLPVVGSVPPMRYMGPAALLLPALGAIGLQASVARDGCRTALVVGGLALVGAAVAIGLAMRSPLADFDALLLKLKEHYHSVNPNLTPEIIRGILGGDASLQAASDRLDHSLLATAGRLAVAGALLIVLGLPRAPVRLRQIVVGLGILLTGAELLAFGMPFNTGRPLPQDDLDTPVHAFLRELDAERADRGGITIVRGTPVAVERIPEDLPTGTLFPEQLRDVNSYAFVDAWSSAPFLEIYGPDRMIRQFWPAALPDDQRLEHPFLDLCGIDVVLSRDVLQHAGEPIGPVVVGPRGDRFFVYLRESALPRAVVVHALEQHADDDAVRAALTDPGLEPRAAVRVTPEVAAALAEYPVEPAPAAAPRPANFVLDRADRVELEIPAGPAGFLVLRDAALSGWSASIDGAPVAVQRGDLFARVVPVPSSACRVVFEYRAPGLLSGAILTALALALSAALAWFAVRRRAKGPSSPDDTDVDAPSETTSVSAGSIP